MVQSEEQKAPGVGFEPTRRNGRHVHFLPLHVMWHPIRRRLLESLWEEDRSFDFVGSRRELSPNRPHHIMGLSATFMHLPEVADDPVYFWATQYLMATRESTLETPNHQGPNRKFDGGTAQLWVSPIYPRITQNVPKQAQSSMEGWCGRRDSDPGHWLPSG